LNKNSRSSLFSISWFFHKFNFLRVAVLFICYVIIANISFVFCLLRFSKLIVGIFSFCTFVIR